jgi:putative sigma-54 modulation protein
MKGKAKAVEFIEDTYSITVYGHHVAITEAMKDYAIEKVSKIDRFTDRIVDIRISMDIQKLEHRVDIVVKIGQLLIKSSAATDDMYASIDLAADKLRNQVLKYKSRIQDHTGKKLSVVDMVVNVLNPSGRDLKEINDDIEYENQRELMNDFSTHQVVSKESIPLKTLRLAEVVMKMDLSGDQFLIYRSEEDRKLKVIYRRKDGNYGVIEIES